MAFQFGALSETNSAPLCFINAAEFVTNSLAVVNLPYTNAGPGALPYECPLVLMAVPASASNGGPATNHAAPGSRLELEFVSLTGPPQGTLSFGNRARPSALSALPQASALGRTASW